MPCWGVLICRRCFGAHSAFEDGEGHTLKDFAAAADDGSTTGERSMRCQSWSDEVKDSERLLCLMLGVNSVLTIIQIVFGLVSNSLSLLGDGALMGMDSVCYSVAIFAERHKVNVAQSERADRLGALFSTVMLAITTTWVLFDAVDRLVGDDIEDVTQPEDKVEVNGSMMIVFTVFNLVVDLLVVFAAWHFGAAMLLEGPKGSAEHAAAGGDVDAEAAASPEVSPEASAAGSPKASLGVASNDENLNIFGALAHLAADGVRGVAVLITGILAVTGLVDPVQGDAYCSLFVCIFVLTAAFSLLRVLVHKSAPVAYEHVEEQNAQGGSSSPQAATIGVASITNFGVDNAAAGGIIMEATAATDCEDNSAPCAFDAIHGKGTCE